MANLAFLYCNNVREVTVGNVAILTSDSYESIAVRHAADRCVETEGFSTAQVCTDDILCLFIDAVCTHWVQLSRVK